MQIDQTPLPEIFAHVPDPRHEQGKRHPLGAILSMMCVAALCGYKTYSAMAEWGRNYGGRYLDVLGFTREASPAKSTLCDLLRRLDEAALEAAIARFVEWLVSSLPSEWEEAWALDGKTLRGSKKQGASHFHLVAIIGHQCGMIIRQELAPIRGDQQPDEIAVVETLLARLSAEGSLGQRVWTMDALHTHAQNATTIVEGGGDYVMAVKANQETLHDEIQFLFTEADRLAPDLRDAMTVHEEWDQGHGRIEWRGITASGALNNYLDWPGVGQVFRVERRRYLLKNGETQQNFVYGITSLSPDQADAEKLGSLVRTHWSIENRLHWVRDVTFDEDRSHVRSGATPQVMAAIRNLAISLLRWIGETNIAAATRRFAAQPEEAIRVIGVQV